MPEYDLLVVESFSKIENASRELLKLDQILEDISRKIQSCLGFDFVAIQLKNKEEQTIETVYGTGSSSEWSGLAKHTIQGDQELWDIQAHIVMHNPPRIEIIAGRDRRFDEYIFNKFKHENQVRVFAPIIHAASDVNLETLSWNVLEGLLPNVDGPSRDDRRTVLEIRSEDLVGANGQRWEAIGTIEAGFHDSGRQIPPKLAKRMAIMAAQRAGDLHRASLENVFRTIAQSARSVTEADAASLHFARVDNDTDAELAHYVYEAWEGRRFPSVTSPRSNGLGQQALQKRQVLFVPDKDLGHDDQYLNKFYRRAYEEGMRAEAAIPIFFREEGDGLYGDGSGDARRPEKQGLLYVRFERPHWFTKGEIACLEVLAARATEAIRRATYDAKERDRARRLTNMHHIARSLAEDPASPFLLEEIAGVALNILAADIVSVYEYEEQEDKFLSDRPTIAGRLIEPDLMTAPLDEMSAPALLLKTRENIYADNAGSNPILSAKRATEQYPNSFIDRERVKSTAALLLRGEVSEQRGYPKEEVLGLMFVSYRTYHRFTSEDHKVTETLASTAAIAIRNRRMSFQPADRLEKAIRKGFEAISRRAIERIERIERAVEPIERIERAIEPFRLLTTATLDNFDGLVTVRICDSDGKDLATQLTVEDGDPSNVTEIPVASPEQSCQAIVRFETSPRDLSSVFQKRLLIRDGNPAETVSFDVVLDSNRIEFTPDHATTTLKSNSGSSSLSFAFKAPQEPGKDDILVEVSQKNRLVQVMRASMTILGDS
jgi:GAF domain-containing protein